MNPMKNISIGLLVLLGLGASSYAEPVRYTVRFKDVVIATQEVTIAQVGDLITTTSAFEADMRVFVATHHYGEALSVTFRPDGTVVAFSARRTDGPVQTEIAATAGAEDVLRVVRTDREGITTNYIPRADYDFHSLILYGTEPSQFLPSNKVARVLNIAEGRIVPTTMQTISESQTTSERQYVRATHLIWGEGPYLSHSWHPERFSNLPTRYIRQSDTGEFIFDLQR